jgi:hypothetical protein
MRIAYIHVLPLEYYPPATTALDILSRQPGWEVRAWSSRNTRDTMEWRSARTVVERPTQGSTTAPLLRRMAGYLNWHLRTARSVARWKPDVVFSIEPHSALATWLYYHVFRGNARLFIHHHEYYSPEDLQAEGMRLIRSTRRLERGDLFNRAEWISQTNEHRLQLLKQWNSNVGDAKGRVLPNYPPEEWIRRARGIRTKNEEHRTRFLYLGSASLGDTFLGEVAEWIAARPEYATLHVTGNNITPALWDKLRSLNASNITLDEAGWLYESIPERLSDFDVGLVLYRGITQNFVYNVPNKAIEYLAGGLEVWYPREMRALAGFHSANPDLRIRQMDFRDLPGEIPRVARADMTSPFPFTAETATRPLVTAIANAD